MPNQTSLKTTDPKQRIIQRFNQKVKGKVPNTSSSNVKHDGKTGHWLETQMGIKHNRDNEPDLFGYEMKTNTTSKTTFGDWSADYYIFKDKKYNLDREKFLSIFGKPNLKKNGRFSWSGEPAPKIGGYNSFGQVMEVDSKNNIIAYYSYDKDLRTSKNKIVPKALQRNDLIIARWDSDSIKNKVERKFKKKGWFKCQQNSDGVYDAILFGGPMTFKSWISAVKAGSIFLDSGMYQGNIRPYSNWRASNNYWDSLVISRH